MEVSKIIARSEWGGFLKEWNISDDMKNPLEDLRRTVKEAQEASGKRKKHESGEVDVGSGGGLVPFRRLRERGKAVHRRSKVLFGISLALAIAGAGVMYFYIKESLTDKFTVPQAIIRAVVIVAVFLVFLPWLSIYGYRHLEVSIVTE